MLVLSRKVGEKIMIGNNVTIIVQRVGKGRVAIAIDAPQDVPVLRGELAPFGLDVETEDAGSSGDADIGSPVIPLAAAEEDETAAPRLPRVPRHSWPGRDHAATEQPKRTSSHAASRR